MSISLLSNQPVGHNLGLAYLTDVENSVAGVSSIIINDITFQDHRHDQSCLSCLCKKYKRKYMLNDETWFQNRNDGINHPILAMRNRGGKSYLY